MERPSSESTAPLHIHQSSVQTDNTCGAHASSASSFSSFTFMDEARWSSRASSSPSSSSSKMTAEDAEPQRHSYRNMLAGLMENARWSFRASSSYLDSIFGVGMDLMAYSMAADTTAYSYSMAPPPVRLEPTRAGVPTRRVSPLLWAPRAISGLKLQR